MPSGGGVVGGLPVNLGQGQPADFETQEAALELSFFTH
jgi:hypothetical protein